MLGYLKYFPVVTLLSVLSFALGVTDVARAAEPVASAVIPPPVAESPASATFTTPTAVPRPKRTATAIAAPKPTSAPKATGAPKATTATASPAKPSSTASVDAWKGIVRSAASPPSETARRTAAQKPSRHAKRERHLQFARASTLPHYPGRPRYYYPGAPVAGPDFDGPPSWYDRGLPPGYPRGPW
jgi:hypothetical protein